VAEIAAQTNLHRQDVYQILPKLEENGLITKTLGTPVTINAIPVEKALKELISIKRKHVSEEIKFMESILKELSDGLKLLNEKERENVEPFFSLLTKESEISNIADLLCEKTKSQCDIVASVELLELKAERWFRRLQTASDKGARIRLIINAPSIDDRVKAIIQRVKPRKGDFTAKFLLYKSSNPFQVFDRKVVWIFTSKKQPSGWPCVLWSNGKHIVETYQERFERFWNDTQEP
jgi:sugar-specific transcriptional regulator TrmB